jgi:hypothetical protein
VRVKHRTNGNHYRVGWNVRHAHRAPGRVAPAYG